MKRVTGALSFNFMLLCLLPFFTGKMLTPASPEITVTFIQGGKKIIPLLWKIMSRGWLPPRCQPSLVWKR